MVAASHDKGRRCRLLLLNTSQAPCSPWAGAGDSRLQDSQWLTDPALVSSFQSWDTKAFLLPSWAQLSVLLSLSILHFFSADWQPSSAPAALPPTHADLLPPMENSCSRPLFPQLPRDQLDCERNLEIFSLLFFHFVLCLKVCHNFQQQRKGKRYARLTKSGRKTGNDLFNNQN